MSSQRHGPTASNAIPESAPLQSSGHDWRVGYCPLCRSWGELRPADQHGPMVCQDCRLSGGDQR